MLKRFEKNHWYIYIGEELDDHWNQYGGMDRPLRHLPLQWMGENSDTEFAFGKFKDDSTSWNWTLKNWIEVEDPHVNSNTLLKGSYYYDSRENKVSLWKKDNRLFCNMSANHFILKPDSYIPEYAKKSISGINIGDEVMVSKKGLISSGCIGKVIKLIKDGKANYAKVRIDDKDIKFKIESLSLHKKYKENKKLVTNYKDIDATVTKDTFYNKLIHFNKEEDLGFKIKKRKRQKFNIGEI